MSAGYGDDNPISVVGLTANKFRQYLFLKFFSETVCGLRCVIRIFRPQYRPAVLPGMENYNRASRSPRREPRQ
jgi:hypothetical protein